MTDERKNGTAAGPGKPGQPGEPDGPVEGAAKPAEDSSELDDLLQAIDAAASDESPETSPRAAEGATESRPPEADETLATTGQTAETPDANATPDDAAVGESMTLDAPGAAPEPAVPEAELEEIVAGAVGAEEPSGTAEPADATGGAVELVEPSPQEHAAADEAKGVEDLDHVGAGDKVAGVVGEVGGRRAEREEERLIGAEVGTPIEPVPLAVAEALAETQTRRRRRALYVLVPAIAVGLLVALTQVRLGGGGEEKPPAARDWERGMELVESGDLTKGLELLENVVASTPLGMKQTFAHARLAEVYADLAKKHAHYLNGAIRHYSAVLNDVSAGRADASALPVDELLYKTGRCFAALGSNETALEYFEQIDREYPASPLRSQARYDLAESLIATRQYDRARQTLAELAEAHRGEPLGERALFRFAASFDEQAQSLEDEP